jgi:hypothetical protein
METGEKGKSASLDTFILTFLLNASLRFWYDHDMLLLSDRQVVPHTEHPVSVITTIHCEALS